MNNSYESRHSSDTPRSNLRRSRSPDRSNRNIQCGAHLVRFEYIVAFRFNELLENPWFWLGSFDISSFMVAIRSTENRLRRPLTLALTCCRNGSDAGADAGAETTAILE